MDSLKKRLTKWWSIQWRENDRYRGGQFNRRENGHVTEVVTLMEGECHVTEVVTKKWSV